MRYYYPTPMPTQTMKVRFPANTVSMGDAPTFDVHYPTCAQHQYHYPCAAPHVVIVEGGPPVFLPQPQQLRPPQRQEQPPKKVRFNNNVRVRPGKTEQFRDRDVWYSDADIRDRKSACRRLIRIIRNASHPLSPSFRYREMCARLYLECAARAEDSSQSDADQNDDCNDASKCCDNILKDPLAHINAEFIACMGFEAKAVRKIRHEKADQWDQAIKAILELQSKHRCINKEIMESDNDSCSAITTSTCGSTSMVGQQDDDQSEKIRAISERASLASRLIAREMAKVYAA